MNIHKAKHVVSYAILMAVAATAMWAYMTITALHKDNDRLEEQVEQLKVQKVIIDANAKLLEEQNQALSNHPLK